MPGPARAGHTNPRCPIWLVDICDGSIACWESRNNLSAIILGRAAVETAATIRTFVADTEKALAAEDLSALNTIAMRLLFGGKSAFWKIDPTLEARNVLTAIQRLERTELPGLLHHYESLSEIAHPNSQGQHQFYSETDKENIVVGFSRTKRLSIGILKLSASLGSVRWSESSLWKLKQLIDDIANLQDRIQPVGGEATRQDD